MFVTPSVYLSCLVCQIVAPVENQITNISIQHVWGWGDCHNISPKAADRKVLIREWWWNDALDKDEHATALNIGQPDL